MMLLNEKTAPNSHNSFTYKLASESSPKYVLKASYMTDEDDIFELKAGSCLFAPLKYTLQTRDFLMTDEGDVFELSPVHLTQPF
jgi:hypothetical protein